MSLDLDRPQRQVILDTETTGLDPADGHRIIEIGCVELVRRRPTGRHYHQYLQPDRLIDPGAEEVHGISNAFLADKPRFSEVCGDFLEFIRDAELIIHNAPFDVGFINHELTLLSQPVGALEDYCAITDSLVMARKLHPGQRNSLDALCRRYQVDNSGRDLHGALLDARILADVYLAMTGGQKSLTLEAEVTAASHVASEVERRLPANRPRLRVIRACEDEQAAHRQMLERLGVKSAW